MVIGQKLRDEIEEWKTKSSADAKHISDIEKRIHDLEKRDEDCQKELASRVQTINNLNAMFNDIYNDQELEKQIMSNLTEHVNQIQHAITSDIYDIQRFSMSLKHCVDQTNQTALSVIESLNTLLPEFENFPSINDYESTFVPHLQPRSTSPVRHFLC